MRKEAFSCWYGSAFAGLKPVLTGIQEGDKLPPEKILPELNELVEYLTPFELVSDTLQAETTPTLAFAWPLLVDLKKHCKLFQEVKDRNEKVVLLNDQVIQKLWKDESLQETLPPLPQIMATILHPTFKALDFAEEQVRAAATALFLCEYKAAGGKIAEAVPNLASSSLQNRGRSAVAPQLFAWMYAQKVRMMMKDWARTKVDE